MVIFIVGRWFFSIEVVKGNVGVEEGGGHVDSGGVMDNGPPIVLLK